MEDESLPYFHFEIESNKFTIVKDEIKSIILQNILSGLVELESKENEIPQVEDFIYLKDICSKTANNLTTIKSLHHKIAKSFNDKQMNLENLKIVNFSILRIDYDQVVLIDYLLVSMLNEFNQLRSKEYDSALINFFERNFDIFKDSKMKTHLEEFETIKVLNINFFKRKNEKEINFSLIYFFMLFFEILFPNLLEVEINFNSDKINEFFYYDNNPYKICEKVIKKVSKKYDKILFTNLIIANYLPKIQKLQNLKVKIFDSYSIEISEMMKHNTDLNKKINYIYLVSILQINNIFCFNCEFNSLDTNLFEKMNYILLKNEALESLTLNLLPEGLTKINLKKIILNDRNYSSQEENNTNNTVSNIDFVNQDDKILKKYFSKFNENLRNLGIIIENKIKKLRFLKLSINRKNIKDMVDFDEFNSAIGCFIFNIITILNKNKNNINLVEFKLDAGNFNFDYNLFKEENKKIHFQHMSVQNFSLHLEIFNLFDLENLLRIENLQNLSLSNISFQDFSNLISLLQTQRENVLVNLNELYIQIKITHLKDSKDRENFNNTLENFFKVRKPANLNKIHLVVKNFIRIQLLISIVHTIKANLDKNIVTDYYLGFSNFKESMLNLCKINNAQLDSTTKCLRILEIDRLKINNFLSFLYVAKLKSKLNKSKILKKVSQFLITKQTKKIHFAEV